MATVHLLGCTKCSGRLFVVDINELERKLVIICNECGHVQGSVHEADCKGTDECEGLMTTDIEGVDF